MIQDLSGSWCIKGTDESILVMGSPVPLMHHDPDRSWITDPDLSEITQRNAPLVFTMILVVCYLPATTTYTHSSADIKTFKDGISILFS